MKIATILGVGLLAITLATTGCSNPQSGSPKTGEKKDGKKEEEHAHGKGPNEGVVFDLGKHHAEFTVDHKAKECTVLIVGDDEKTPLPVEAKELTVTTKETKTKAGVVVAPMTIKLLPKDEKQGKASRFVGGDPGLGNVADFAGTVLGEINGRPSQGEFKE
jgi:hypothetical protein